MNETTGIGEAFSSKIDMGIIFKGCIHKESDIITQNIWVSLNHSIYIVNVFQYFFHLGPKNYKSLRLVKCIFTLLVYYHNNNRF